MCIWTESMFWTCNMFRWRQPMAGAATRATVALCMCNASWVIPPVNSCSQSWQVPSMDIGASHGLIVLIVLLDKKNRIFPEQIGNLDFFLEIQLGNPQRCASLEAAVWSDLARCLLWTCASMTSVQLGRKDNICQWQYMNQNDNILYCWD